MPTLRPGFLHIPPTVMTVLTQFGVIGRDFGQGAASFRNYAGQMRYKHPWCSRVRRFDHTAFAIP